MTKDQEQRIHSTVGYLFKNGTSPLMITKMVRDMSVGLGAELSLSESDALVKTALALRLRHLDRIVSTFDGFGYVALSYAERADALVEYDRLLKNGGVVEAERKLPR